MPTASQIKAQGNQHRVSASSENSASNWLGLLSSIHMLKNVLEVKFGYLSLINKCPVSDGNLLYFWWVKLFSISFGIELVVTLQTW